MEEPKLAVVKTDLQTQQFSRARRYTPPTAGVLSLLPPKLVPFGELIRIDKPVGFIYLYTPCASGTLLAASLSDPITPPKRLLITNLILFFSSVLFRSAACSWNDTADKEIDPKVARTRLRPMARGAVSPTEAHVCTALLLVAFLFLQSTLPTHSGAPLTTACIQHSVPFIIAAAIYPFMKRFTNYPQVVLGFLLGWGVVLAFPALNVDLFASQTRMAAAGCTLVSVMAWTILYDTIYAFQDLADDIQIGAKSVAVRYSKNPKVLFGGLAAIQVLSLIATGWAVQAGNIYLAGVLLVAGLLGIVVTRVNVRDPKSCGRWFTTGCHYVGATIVCCFLSEYVMRLPKSSLLW